LEHLGATQQSRDFKFPCSVLAQHVRYFEIPVMRHPTLPSADALQADELSNRPSPGAANEQSTKLFVGVPVFTEARATAKKVNPLLGLGFEFFEMAGSRSAGKSAECCCSTGSIVKRTGENQRSNQSEHKCP
jgi:hypothetical protein